MSYVLLITAVGVGGMGRVEGVHPRVVMTGVGVGGVRRVEGVHAVFEEPRAQRTTRAISPSGPEIAAMLRIGTIVKRGVDWKWGDQVSIHPSLQSQHRHLSICLLVFPTYSYFKEYSGEIAANLTADLVADLAMTLLLTMTLPPTLALTATLPLTLPLTVTLQPTLPLPVTLPPTL